MTENDTVRAISEWPVNGLTGRRKIYTAKKKVTPENVVEVLGKALAVHRINRAETVYLYDFYKGKQDIRLKDKIVRPEINNKVMINRANEIVTFKTAYLLDGPIRYVSNGGEDDVSAGVNTLNEYMRAESKDTLDKELADWMHICGVAVRMVLPDKAGEEDGSPVSIYTLDPRAAFCIYHSGVGQKKVAGVLEQVDEEGQPYFCVYTPEWYFEVQNGQITKQEGRTIPYIPIVEYVNNDARMGAFEPVIPILNAINMIESNRLDSIQDFVNAFDFDAILTISIESPCNSALYRAQLFGRGAEHFLNFAPNVRQRDEGEYGIHYEADRGQRGHIVQDHRVGRIRPGREAAAALQDVEARTGNVGAAD